MFIDKSIRSPNYTPRAQVASVFGQARVIKSITVHQWDDVAKKPTFEGTRSWFAQRRENPTSAHYVVEDGRWAEMVDPLDAAWHAGNPVGNATSIGIEMNPRCTAGDVAALVLLIVELEKRFGSLTIYPHNYWTNTACPGRYGPRIQEIVDRANSSKTGAVATPGMVLPVGNAPISQGFGENKTIFNVAGHTGTDFAVPTNTPVKATANGKVLYANWATGFVGATSQWYLVAGAGIVVVIDHGGYLSVSAHLNSTPLNTGDRVTRNQEIGKSGSTGNSTGPHLHFEIIPLPLNNRGDGMYGRINAIPFINASSTVSNIVGPAGATTGGAITKDWFDMATEQTLEAAVNNVMQKSKGLIKQCVHEVLHDEQLRREGSVNGKAIGGTTTFGLEARYAAQNHGRTSEEVKSLRKDVIFAQNQIARQDAAISELKELLIKALEVK